MFDRAYAHAPQTLPSHASMFTGHLPFEHEVRDNLGFTLNDGPADAGRDVSRGGIQDRRIRLRVRLAARDRRRAGASTSTTRRFRRWPPIGRSHRSSGPGPQTLAAADAWLSSLTSDRFFLFLHLYEPHKPYRAPERFADLAAYDGEVAFADEIVGTLFASLKTRGWYDTATIVVLADHGEGLGDHIEEEHGLFLYDEVIRVPWIMRLPRAQSAGRRVKDPVQHIDLLPTLAALAGLAVPPGLRGRDLSVALFGRGGRRAQGIYAEALYPRYHFGWSELLSLTDDRFRYIKAPREELYDLERDPGERTNIAARARAGGDRAPVRARRARGRPGHRRAVRVSDDDRQRLAALGYVGTQSSSAGRARRTRAPIPRTKRRSCAPIGRPSSSSATAASSEGTRLLRAILDDDPAMTDVWSQYAAALGRLGRYQEAFEAYAQRHQAATRRGQWRRSAPRACCSR